MSKKPKHVVVAVECDLPKSITPARFKQYVLDQIRDDLTRMPADSRFADTVGPSLRATVIPRNIEWFLRRTAGGMDSPLYRRWFG